MSKVRKRRYEKEKGDASWLVVFKDTFSWDNPDSPIIISEPPPEDEAYEEMLRLKDSEGYVFGNMELREIK